MKISEHFFLEDRHCARVLHMVSADRMNRLTRERVLELSGVIQGLAREPKPLIITGNDHFFSSGADLNEISELSGPAAYEFAKMGQALMNAVDGFPALTVAAIRGYCLGGGLDLALACDMRIATAHAVFGHRGAALGLITGWGGTQRLPKLVGRARALQMFVAAEKLGASAALEIGLINAIAANPVSAALERISGRGL